MDFLFSCITRWPKILGYAWRILDHFGFFSTENARDILNDILREKLGLPEGWIVRFSDMDPVNRSSCCRLKIITTSLATGGLRLFDHTTPNVAVADAVSASFSIPVFFKPSRVRTIDDKGAVTLLDDRFVDGGLVSNLPVWVFFEDKRLVERLEDYRNAPPIPIIAFTLDALSKDSAGAKSENPVLKLAAFLTDVVRVGISGGQSVAQNFVTHLTVIEMPTPLTVIEFDCSREAAREAYDSGRRTASAKLKRIFQINPFARREVLKDISSLIGMQSAALRNAAGAAPVRRFRACVLRPLGDSPTPSFKVIASIGMDRDPDDDLILDPGYPTAPVAYRERDFSLFEMVDPAGLPMTKYERALLWRDLKTVISIPIFATAAEWSKAAADRAKPSGVLCIDSDSDLNLEFADPILMKALALATVRLAPFMIFDKETP